MRLKAELEKIESYVAQGNTYCAQALAAALLNCYARQADKNKILAALAK